MRIFGAVSLGVGGVAFALALSATPVFAVASECESQFPDVQWSLVSAGPVSIYEAGVADGLVPRFEREIRVVEEWVTDDIGPFTTTVCLVAQELRSIGDQYVSGSQQFQAHQDLARRFVLLNTQRPALIGPAAAFALAHQALYQNNGDDAFPEPIASVIAYWFRARLLDRMRYYQRDVMVSNFFDTDSVVDWTEFEQTSTMDWVPENNFRSIGAFVDYAVSERGNEVLSVTDPAVWTSIEAEWRVALRQELSGRSEPTTDWIGGVGVAVAILIAAVGAIVIGLVSKYRKKRYSETAAPIPGFFSDD